MITFVYYKSPNIYLVRQKKVEPLCDLGALPGRPVPTHSVEDLAMRRDGRLYILCKWQIFLLSPTQNQIKLLHCSKNKILRRCTVRREGTRDILYFIRDQSYSETEIVVLYNDEEAIPYHTLHRDDLEVPNPCDPGGPELPSFLSPCYFAFDDENNLYLSNGPQKPCGFYKLSGAKESGVTGIPQRIHLSQDRSCYDLECRDANTLYYLSGKNTSSPHVEIRRIDMLPLPLTDEVAYSGAHDANINRGVKGISLTHKLALSEYFSQADIRWVQKSLNIIFPTTPLVPIDGKLSAETRNAVKSFQAYWMPNAPADGLPGSETRAKIIQILRSHFPSSIRRFQRNSDA